ncbi:MAG: hypothetical protein H6713_32620 [Myxococcales bacterium]|nr:hypothetical protein [Myxococcales bacterium]MCB9754706.1 hypothetical protein [Myxococcales bacterium]
MPRVARLSSVLAGVVVGAAVTLTAGAAAAKDGAFLVGDEEAGYLRMPLHRGGAVPLEFSVAVPSNGCSGDDEMVLEIAWSKQENYVHVHLQGEGILDPHPDFSRPESEWQFNPFLAETKDIEDGRYQFWIASAAGPPIVFYYAPDPEDPQVGPVLLGSQFDFEVPPEGAIPVALPTLQLFSSPMMQPDEDGNLDYDWVFDYDTAGRGDFPGEFSHHFVTFPGPELCGMNPFRLDLSHLRPYFSGPRPIEEAVDFGWYLRGGLLFDLTIEPGEYYDEAAPKTTTIGTYSGGTAIAGGIPEGWSMDIMAAFMGLAPPIKPWAGADQCLQTFDGFRDLGINFCAPPQP